MIAVHAIRRSRSNRHWRRADVHVMEVAYGFTLIELLIAAALTALLVGGLASALFISSKTLTADGPASSDANRAGLVLGQVSRDLRHALRFSERTATAASFAVPDRTGDGKPETIRYSWSGTIGDPLMYQYNGAAALPILDDVKQFQMNRFTRAIPGAALDMPVASSVTYEAFAEGKSTSETQYCVVPAPAGSSQGKLLIAAVAVEDGQGSTLLSQAGWNRLAELNRSDDVGLGVWWKIAGPDEPAWYIFFWPGYERSYGWVMRFSGAHVVNPIHASGTRTGDSSAAQCSAVTTTAANCLILRIGGFDKDRISVDNPGMAGHAAITMDKSSDRVSGGAAYATLAAPGSAGTASFSLTNGEKYATVTVAIAPNAAN